MQDIHLGRGVCVIDPHGDTAEDIASSIPRHRISETVYFDAGDQDYPIGFNPLTDRGSADQRELPFSWQSDFMKV